MLFMGDYEIKLKAGTFHLLKRFDLFHVILPDSHHMLEQGGSQIIVGNAMT